jgi:hypothetical protein
MNASRRVFSRLLAALTLLGLARCSREEAARPAAARAERSATEGGALHDAAAPPAAAVFPLAAVAPGAPAFQTLAPGLSVLADRRTDAEGHEHEWLVTRIDLQQHRLQARALGDSPFTRLQDEAGLLVAVNGGFFAPNLEPSGLLLSGGSLLARERSGGGSGVLAVAKQQARLLKRGEALPEGADFAVQCGPRLIEPGGALGIRSDDGQRAARTAVCIREAGRELDLIVTLRQGHLGGGPSLLQLAQWLAGPLAPGEPSGCEAALNLDGGPSTGVVVAGRPELVRLPLGPVPFALLVAR